MSYIFKGNLAAYICRDCSEYISHVKIRIYYPLPEINIAAVSVAQVKDTFKEVSEEEIRAKEKRLIAEIETDMKGDFSVEISEKFARSALELDFYCGSVPRPPFPPKKGKPRQFHITTFFPQWKTAPNQDAWVANFNYIIPEKWWCIIKGRYFDVWTICGRLIDCDSKKPLEGITVIAMDADFITDDELGRNTTDSNGYFRIYYTSVEFKKTFLSPLINIETDIIPPFASGPDVYFQLEYGGQRFALETAADRRNNVGYCLCVSLCSKELIPVDPSIPPSFTHFGLNQHIPIQSGINLGTGKTLGGYAFFSSVNLVGTISKKISAQPMEYLFEYQEVSNPSNPLNPSAWFPIVPNMIDKTTIGYLWTLTGDPMNPIAYEPYYINGTGTEKTITFNGNWIQVPQDSNFAAHVDAEIMKLNTVKLTGITSLDMSMPTSSIGSASVSPARPHTTNKYFAIRMKQRQQGNPSSEAVAGTSKPIAIFNVVYENVNKHGSWAPTTVNDQYIALSLDIQEIVSGSSGCSKITTDLHIKYTARNENLSDVSLSITGPTKPGHSYGFDPIVLMPAPETFGSAQLVFTPPTDTVADLLPCAYTVTVSATALLTTGEDNLGSYYDFVSFCKV